MSYEQALQIVIAILPFLVVVLVGLAKKAGMMSTYAPALTTIIAVVVAALLYRFYPFRDFNAILATLMSCLAAGTVYGWKKEYQLSDGFTVTGEK